MLGILACVVSVVAEHALQPALDGACQPVCFAIDVDPADVSLALQHVVAVGCETGLRQAHARTVQRGVVEEDPDDVAAGIRELVAGLGFVSHGWSEMPSSRRRAACRRERARSRLIDPWWISYARPTAVTVVRGTARGLSTVSGTPPPALHPERAAHHLHRVISIAAAIDATASFAQLGIGPRCRLRKPTSSRTAALRVLDQEGDLHAVVERELR